MAWFVYILRCADGTLYTGVTTDVARRLLEHGSGRGARYTRARGPVALAWSEGGHDRSGALRREAQIKGMARAEKAALISRGRASPRPGSPG